MRSCLARWISSALASSCQGRRRAAVLRPGRVLREHLVGDGHSYKAACGHALVVHKHAESAHGCGDRDGSRAIGRADIHPHDLRHTAVSLAIKTGANVKAVQQMLGHASAAMTLDVYAGLFEDDLDSVATAMDALLSAATDDETSD